MANRTSTTKPTGLITSEGRDRGTQAATSTAVASPAKTSGASRQNRAAEFRESPPRSSRDDLFCDIEVLQHDLLLLSPTLALGEGLGGGGPTVLLLALGLELLQPVQDLEELVELCLPLPLKDLARRLLRLVVHGIVALGVLLDVLADFHLLRPRQHRRRVRPPRHAEELFLLLGVQIPSLECPNLVAGLHGVLITSHLRLDRLRDGGNDVARRGIPLHIGEHVMLVLVENLQVVALVQSCEKQVATAADAGDGSNRSNHEVLAFRSPNNRVKTVGGQVEACDVLRLFPAEVENEQLRFVPLLIRCDHGEPATLRLPKKALDHVLEGDDVHRDRLFPDAKDLQVRGDAFPRLAQLRDLQAQVITLRLPMHFRLALSPRTRSELAPGGDLHKHKTRGIVVLLSGPYRENVVLRRPREALQRVELQARPLARVILQDLEAIRVSDDDP
mmetsp:Transcript_96170/g.188892  ORF Transcript_96170/g.188892 Transcript_96170/m.188892 type:complete len:446 (-) Transcript_96170:793-2130(-)